VNVVTYKLLDTVVLTRDLEASGLRHGDLGAIVELHPDGAFEVEFVAASGRTLALVTLQANDIRAVGDGDLLAVRQAAG
jgi:hypothetical protein